MSLEIYLRGTIWHYRGTVAGRRLRGTTETGDKATARRIADKKAEAAWSRKLDGAEATMTFAQAMILYVKAGKGDDPSLLIAEHWKDTPVRDITSSVVREAANKLYPNNTGASKNRRVIAPTQAVLNHAFKTIESNTRFRIERFKESHKIKEPATWAWIQAFMKAARPREAALACLMFTTAARISEALNIHWQDINFEARTILIREGKTKKERIAHMPLVLIEALQALPSNRQPTARVFCRWQQHHRNMWNKACVRAGIKKLTFHCCRHGFATKLLHSGIDPITTAKLGGWASPAYVFSTYGHAMLDTTLTDRLIDTELTQAIEEEAN